MSNTLALLSLATCLHGAPPMHAVVRVDSVRPIFMSPSDPNPYPGEVVSYTVGFSMPALAPGSITISSTTMGNFSALPSQVSYNTGDQSATFWGTVSQTASGSIQVTAAMPGGNISLTSVVAAVQSSLRF